MKALFDPAQRLHRPASMIVRGVTRPSQDQPERIDRLLEALDRGGLTVTRPPEADLSAVAAVHTPRYLHFLEHGPAQWAMLDDASEQIVPNVHPRGRGATYPDAVVGRAGWHAHDAAAPIGPDTYSAALASAGSAVGGAELLLAGEPRVYSLCRPSGHHAGADSCAGFCYLNNAAVAATQLRRVHDRVAVLDIDAHHGNGTQAIFAARADVLTVSIHADPRDFYPFYWGHAHERGDDDGEGFNRNLPLALGAGDDAFLAALETATRLVTSFAPGALVVSLGLDAAATDPLRALAVSTGGFRRIGAAIGGLGLPTLYVQEGGYLSAELTDNLTAFLKGAAGE